MKIPTIQLFYLFLFSILLSCSADKKALPPLTYSGTEPRVQDPLSPAESQQHIQLPDGFTAELFAAEPDIINPIAFTWDERGRLWVVQSQDYPHKLENDVGGDRITICEDTDGDGKADQFTDFATEQSLTTGIVVVQGGIIVAQAPNLVFLQDTDGDDVMDKSRVLVKGFGIWDTHAGPANLKYGVDNMIWGSVGYSGFESTIGGVDISFKMGVFRFAKDGGYFEPIGQFNNNTWGLGFNENFEIFGSTANNNHACYVGIPLKHYDYLYKRPKWAINADFIQGHYDITAADTVPLQQVDVRGGYTAAAGANFYTARNYPAEYQNQMYVNEPTGHVVHLARIEQDGAGYKEVDGGNIFASTDSWTAPVYTETGPDGNLWVADWYNPVIQHNPDKRGMENQIWNDNKGEGNAHLNEFRDLRHGRIYILKYKRAKKSPITAIDPEDDDALLTGIQSDNMFWRTTAQRLIVEGNKQQLIPKLLEIAADDNASDGAVLHTLWTLNALGAWGDEANTELLTKALGSSSYAVQRAAVALIPESEAGSNMLASSGLFTADHLQIRLAALLRATELPETDALYQAVEALAKVPSTSEDKWLSAALNVYYKTPNLTEVDPAKVSMIMSNDMPRKSIWSYTQEQPTDNWYATDFDDTNWKRGPAPFRGERAEKGETTWSTSDIWIRRDLTLKDDLDEAVLKIRNNEKYEVYVNGQLLFAEAGRNSEYKYIRLDEEQSALFKKGKNVIAAYCHKEKGNRLLDVQIGQITKPKADVVFNINTVNQKMAYDKTLLKAEAGQTVQIRLNNGDEMPHNLVVIKAGSLQNFGKVVDAFLQEPEAEEMDYVPNSRYVLSATPMLDPGESASIIFELPNLPGRYPFVCTFPGHWRAMQGEILVTAPGSYLAADPKATQVAVMGGGGSHDFLRFFGIADGKVLSDGGKNSVVYTEDGQHLKNILHEQDVLFLSNNQPFDRDTKSAILARAREGMGMMINHPSVWYNWTDWPQYNKEIVGGGSRSHEKFQEFEVKVVKPDHPIMKDVPAQFNIVDELYRWEQDETGTPVEVLAIGKSLETGEEYPVVWTVNHPDTKIVGNTLGHDEKAHNLKAYKTIIRNSIRWVKGEDQVDF